MHNPPSVGMTEKHTAVLMAVLGVAIFAPTMLANATSFGLPGWAGAATGVAALVAAFVVMWRAGGLRARFIFLFLATIAAVFSISLFMGGRP